MTDSNLANYQQAFDELLGSSVYGLAQEPKEAILLRVLENLHQHHLAHCQPYASIFASHGPSSFARLQEVPYLAVRLFKHLALTSVPDSEVFKVLRSSGTTGQATAQIFLDRQTSTRQSKVLVKILQQSIGKQRLPMLIIDSPAVLKDKQLFSARGAGIQGLAFFGRDHTYALNDDMQPDWPTVEAFAEKYQGQPVLMFGFTFMVWKHFLQQLSAKNKTLRFDGGSLLHSGGWKKLEQQKVSNEQFTRVAKEHLGISQVVNFYGMAEQVGSVFVECSEGHLHAPAFADVVMRNPYNFSPCDLGEQGIIQVLSALPTSYPGQSILTEDLGVILGIDDCGCGRKGKYFKVDGRLPKTELRGCSDTHQVPV